MAIKRVTVKGLKLQFDMPAPRSWEANKEHAQDMVCAVNDSLMIEFKDSQPQFIWDTDKIEIKIEDL